MNVFYGINSTESGTDTEKRRNLCLEIGIYNLHGIGCVYAFTNAYGKNPLIIFKYREFDKH